MSKRNDTEWITSKIERDNGREKEWNKGKKWFLIHVHFVKMSSAYVTLTLLLLVSFSLFHSLPCSCSLPPSLHFSTANHTNDVFVILCRMNFHAFFMPFADTLNIVARILHFFILCFSIVVRSTAPHPTPPASGIAFTPIPPQFPHDFDAVHPTAHSACAWLRYPSRRSRTSLSSANSFDRN